MAGNAERADNETRAQRVRLIRREPVITTALESYKPILPRPMREARLKTWRKAEEVMRSEQFRVTMIVQGVLYGTIAGLTAALEALKEPLTAELLQRMR